MRVIVAGGDESVVLGEGMFTQEEMPQCLSGGSRISILARAASRTSFLLEDNAHSLPWTFVNKGTVTDVCGQT